MVAGEAAVNFFQILIRKKRDGLLVVSGDQGEVHQNLSPIVVAHFAEVVGVAPRKSPGAGVAVGCTADRVGGIRAIDLTC